MPKKHVHSSRTSYITREPMNEGSDDDLGMSDDEYCWFDMMECMIILI